MRPIAAVLPICSLLGLTAADPRYSGFTTYAQVFEGQNNDFYTTARQLDRSNTLVTQVQILTDGSSHQKTWDEFATLCKNWGTKNVTVIPRLRYGNKDGSYSAEPSSLTIIQSDLAAWTELLSTLINNKTCDIPLIQAGILGEYGEWHDGPYCKVAGNASTNEAKNIKRQIIRSLLTTGTTVAVRTPMDHAVIAQNLTCDELKSFTIHDDCILADGPTGSDIGTFIDTDGKTADQWRAYTQANASGNAFGGEGCNVGNYAWGNTTQLCGDSDQGMISYINVMQIAYLNSAWPPAISDLFQNKSAEAIDCVNRMQTALQSQD